ncbi:MAG TPA: zinc-dependent metalloprotease [Candidatus Sulfotelmatobacter sp.]|nr:zinc-dependent metalloprotease [Candidatus Sulfotelmatobacter sp.]
MRTTALSAAPSPAPSPAAAAPNPSASPAPAAVPATEPTAGPQRPILPITTVSAAVHPLVIPPPTPTYEAFVKDATTQHGVIDIVRKDDELYFDLRPENFDHTYILMPSIERGVGSGAFAGRVYDPIQVTFKRVGKRVLWITPNSHYVADKGTAAANSLAISVADSVILSTPIVAEDPKKEHTVIAPSVFMTDFEGIGADLGKATTPPSLPGLLVIMVRPSYAVDATKSYYGATKAFPRNDEITVNLAFNGPPNALPTVPDGRGIPIVMHYSLVAEPERDPRFVPRNADDRVGYFITARKRFGDDGTATPFERFIERWNLDDGPITFYLTNEIPPEYRDTVRRGILAWNAAFAKIGHPNAIVVKDPPSDPNWDPDDARYTTVRWITSDVPDFSAYSPHVSDPDTGQIIRAEVVIDGEALRTIKSGYVDRVLPALRARRDPYAVALQNEETLSRALLTTPPPPVDALPSASQDDDSVDETCEFEESSASQAALGTMLLERNPKATASDRDRYAQEWLYSTVMHEVGHTLGLRHNFEGSEAFSYDELHDPAFTRVHGTTGSVMDYTPANLAAPGERQADYFPTQLGPYDYFAIEYGYRSFPNVHTSADEAIPLSRIAARSTEPGLAYGTDEDATVFSVDPHIQLFDLSNDALRYADEQFRIDADVAGKLLRTYPGDSRSYQDLRAQLVTVLNDELDSAAIASKYIGGIATSRAHRLQPGAPLPLTPISRAEERRAFALLDRWVFSSHAFNFSPELLDAVVPSRYGLHWDSGGVRRADFPIREIVAEIQDDMIEQIFSPVTMARIADQEVKQSHPGETMTLSDLFAWTNAAIYDDVGQASIAPAHRELQRRFADLELAIVSLPSSFADQLNLPRETQSIARANLVKLAAKLAAGERTTSDPSTRAHLADLLVRVRGVLHATNVRQV